MNSKVDPVPYIFLIALISIISPLLLIPIESLFPFPYVIEEIVKALLACTIVLFLPKSFHLKISILAGILFALSENVFFLSNFYINGILNIFFLRVALTSALHVLTIIVITFLIRRNLIYILPATLIAIAIHFLYNQAVLNYF